MKGKTVSITGSFQGIEKQIILTKSIVQILGFAVLTGISAGLKLEIGAVPVTAQTLIVLLSGALLGSKKGALSQFTYLAGGLIGFPWFSRGGGMVYIMSPTFGYILGFVLASYFTGLLFEKGWDKEIKKSVLVLLIASFAIYIPGLLWLARFIGFSKILTVGFYPFVIGDILKISLVALILSFSLKQKKVESLNNLEIK
ncbi:MAG: biotin transporter BioY [Candidatus Nealsonbacteria bacterium]